MSDIRVDKVTIGSPTYKVVVGDYTRVLKIEVGAPTRNVLVSNQVELEDVIGVTITEPISEGQLLIADSTGEYVNTNVLGANIEIDGLVYERDSDRGIIRVRRSATEGVPTFLKGGELAYSYLANFGTDSNNGGERLYIGIDSATTGFASRIDIIGGKYFTDLLDHEHGVLTPSSAVLVDSIGYVNELLVGDLTAANVDADSANISNLSVQSLNITSFDSINTTGNLDVAGDVSLGGTVTFGQLDPNDLLNSLDNILRAGIGISLAFDSSLNTITISGKLATEDSAGIVRLDSSQFQDTGGVNSVVFLTGGSF